MPGLACLLEQLLLSHCLGSNACVISSREEESFIPVHALIADQCVLDSDSKGVSDVEVACDVGGRECDGEPLRVGGLVVGMEEFTR